MERNSGRQRSDAAKMLKKITAPITGGHIAIHLKSFTGAGGLGLVCGSSQAAASKY